MWHLTSAHSLLASQHQLPPNPTQPSPSSPLQVFERAISNVPPAPEKRYWQRYIYLWIKYALFEELEAGESLRLGLSGRMVSGCWRVKGVGEGGQRAGVGSIGACSQHSGLLASPATAHGLPQPAPPTTAPCLFVGAEDGERAREVYRACLKLIPHKLFTFGKVRTLQGSEEVR